jgi:hypothetical protein
MSPEQFVFWLRGYLAAQIPADGAKGQLDRITETLAIVLTTVKPYPARPDWAPVELPPPVPPFIVTCGTPLRYTETKASHAD